MKRPDSFTARRAYKTILSFMRSGLRTARIPLQLRTLRKYRDAGLPREVQPALSYLITGQLGKDGRAVASRVEELRDGLARRGSLPVAEYTRTLDPEADPRDVPGVGQKSFAQIAERVSVPQSFGLFLYLCASGFKARRILELGSCAGISGCYLASTPSCVEFVTIERSRTLTDIARDNLSHVSPNATVINADFDRGLSAVLGPETAPFDVVWIDGNHEKEATLRYFRCLRRYVSPGGLILFDDIGWRPEMGEAWDEIRSWPGFSITLNVSRLGMAILRKESRPDEEPPQNWQLKRRLGIWNLEREAQPL